MKRTCDEQELVEHWTLFEPERALLANRTGTGKLAVTVLLKFFQLNAQFPRYHRDVPAAVLDFVAKQLDVEPAPWFDYDLKGRSGKRDREQVRTFLGFRPITLEDEERLRQWLEHDAVVQDIDERHLRVSLLDWCRAHHLEPPSDSSAVRIIASAVHGFEERLFARIHDQLFEQTCDRLDALIVVDEAAEQEDELPSAYSAFNRLKSGSGRVGLASAEREIEKLALLDALELPAELWRTISPKLLARYCARAATESARELRRHRPAVRYALLTAYCYQRRRELTDGLLDLLIQIVHRLSVRAEKRISTEMVGELKHVGDKTGILFRIAEAALENPEGSVRGVMPRKQLQERLLLCLYGLGTNAGLKRMAATNVDVNYHDLLYVRRRFIEKSALREAIRRVVNSTLAPRLEHIWGEGTTSCASDSKQFGAWDQNLMTEWHNRYGGRGVMIYWHVEKRSTSIYSQLKRCSSSEVAAMIEGVLRHCTDMRSSATMSTPMARAR